MCEGPKNGYKVIKSNVENKYKFKKMQIRRENRTTNQLRKFADA